MYGDFFGNLENHHCIDLLFGQFLKKWATFNSNIGPTACDVPAIFSVRVSLSKLFLPVDTTWVIRPASFNLTFEIKKLNDLINAGNKFLQDGDYSTSHKIFKKVFGPKDKDN